MTRNKQIRNQHSQGLIIWWVGLKCNSHMDPRHRFIGLLVPESCFIGYVAQMSHGCTCCSFQLILIIYGLILNHSFEVEWNNQHFPKWSYTKVKLGEIFPNPNISSLISCFPDFVIPLLSWLFRAVWDRMCLPSCCRSVIILHERRQQTTNYQPH